MSEISSHEVGQMGSSTLRVKAETKNSRQGEYFHSHKFSSLSIIAGALSAWLLAFVLLVMGAYIALYVDSGYYEREYIKYDVLSALPVEMTLSDEDGVMAVSDHMMAYLISGNTPDELQITVMMDGRLQPFFSAREISHMWDVRVLFKRFIVLAFVCAIGAVIIHMTAAIFMRPDLGKFLNYYGVGMLAGLGILVILICILILLISRDFNAAFVTFHHVFFDNDLWLLDPRYDMMINILPIGFFADTAIRIGSVYAFLMGFMVLLAIWMISRGRWILTLQSLWG